MEVPRGVKIRKKSKHEKCSPRGVSVEGFSPFPKILTFEIPQFFKILDFRFQCYGYPREAKSDAATQLPLLDLPRLVGQVLAVDAARRGMMEGSPE